MSSSDSAVFAGLRILFTIGIAVTSTIFAPPGNAERIETAADAASYPSHPIHVVVPLAPGGATDALARQVSARLAQRLGQQIIIENKSGANTSIGAEYVARSTPDGYTLLFTNDSTLVVDPLLFASLPYKPGRDFEPVATVAYLNLTLTVAGNLPVRNFKEFVAYTKANSGKISYGSSGIGSQLHLMGEMYKKLTGTDIVHVPYKGVGPALTDLLGGRILFTFPSIATIQGLLEDGRVKVLAISGDKRSPILPDVPTFAEVGFEDMNIGAWYGFVAPAGTPKAIVAKLNAAIADVLSDAALQKDFVRQGMLPLERTPGQFATYIRDDSARVARIIKLSGATVQ